MIAGPTAESPALDALLAAIVCVERRHRAIWSLDRSPTATWLDCRVAMNVLRELDVLLSHALIETAAAAGHRILPRRDDAAATLATCRRMIGAPIDHQQALRELRTLRARYGRHAACLRGAVQDCPGDLRTRADAIGLHVDMSVLASTHRTIAVELRSVRNGMTGQAVPLAA